MRISDWSSDVCSSDLKGVRYTNIVTTLDEVVVPYTSGIEAGMTNITLQKKCGLDLSDHLSIVSSRTAADLVLNTLRSEERRVGKECVRPCRSRWWPVH